MNREFLQKHGFEGFVTIGELMTGTWSQIPAQMGVYVVLRESEAVPHFLPKGTGGFFKGDPNVPIAELEAHWVKGAEVVYIGKAGGLGISATLQKRLRLYLRFGQGRAVGHRGGRFIWQLSDSQKLVVCWRTLTDEDPRDVERKMIADFKAAHEGKRPFANLID